jgi:Protein of unknown function (DUF3108)
MRAFFPVFVYLGLAIGFALARAEDKPDPGPPAPVDFKQVPWKDNEALTYLISIGMFEAAEGTFTAHDKGKSWEFDLSLASRGLVDEFYSFTGSFWCILTKSPWRSDEYGEYRFEPKRTIKERTQIDYDKHQGMREIWVEGKTKTFPIAEDSIDDVGTLLYHIRAVDWKPGDHRVFHVYESSSEKEALVDCQARESLAWGHYPKQPLLRLLALPGKGTHHRGKLMLWMTDDARHLPLHADLEFRYGTCSIDLTKDAVAKK